MSDKKSEMKHVLDSYDTQPTIAPPPYSPSAPSNAIAVTTTGGTSFLSRSASKLGKMFSHKQTAPGAMEAVLKPILEKFDIVFIVDDSGSMNGSRWSEARKALMPIADIASRYDDNGIDIHFLNHRRVGKGLKSAAEVIALFDEVGPCGATPLGETLRRVIRPYREQLQNAHQSITRDEELAKIKPVNYIVVTDGMPTDETTEDVLLDMARLVGKWKLPKEQIGVQFIQIGDSKEASEFLESLDDFLHKTDWDAVDIVDTTKYQSGKKLDAERLIKMLVGSINRRVDNEGGKIYREDLGTV